MAGRGGGRGGGRGKAPARSSINLMATALGIEQADLRPQGFTQPTSLFPPQLSKPVSLSQPGDMLTAEDHEYMVSLKQELLTWFRDSAYYSDEEDDKRKDIERYTDRLKKPPPKDWEPYWDRLPKELQLARGKASLKRKRMKDESAVAQRLEELENKEIMVGPGQPERGGEEGEDKKEGAEDDEEEANKKAKISDETLEAAEEEDEDEGEEFNDYLVSHFDPGEEYGDAESDDNLEEGAVF